MCVSVCVHVFVPALRRKASSKTDLIVEPMVLQGRLHFQVFPLLQMRQKEGKNSCKGGSESKGKTKRESERDVICLQSIGCTSDHSWDPTIICFHLSASFHFFLFLFNSVSPYFLF